MVFDPNVQTEQAIYDLIDMGKIKMMTKGQDGEREIEIGRTKKMKSKLDQKFILSTQIRFKLNHCLFVWNPKIK